MSFVFPVGPVEHPYYILLATAIIIASLLFYFQAIVSSFAGIRTCMVIFVRHFLVYVISNLHVYTDISFVCPVGLVEHLVEHPYFILLATAIASVLALFFLYFLAIISSFAGIRTCMVIIVRHFLVYFKPKKKKWHNKILHGTDFHPPAISLLVAATSFTRALILRFCSGLWISLSSHFPLLFVLFVLVKPVFAMDSGGHRGNVPLFALGAITLPAVGVLLSGVKKRARDLPVADESEDVVQWASKLTRYLNVQKPPLPAINKSTLTDSDDDSEADEDQVNDLPSGIQITKQTRKVYSAPRRQEEIDQIVAVVHDASGKYKLEAYHSNNTDGVGFIGSFNGTTVSGNDTRICVTGLPGVQIGKIPRFYVDKAHRSGGHGRNLMALLCLMYASAGTTELEISTPNANGTRFYPKCGFQKDDMGDFRLALQGIDWNSRVRLPASPLMEVGHSSDFDVTVSDSDEEVDGDDWDEEVDDDDWGEEVAASPVYETPVRRSRRQTASTSEILQAGRSDRGSVEDLSNNEWTVSPCPLTPSFVKMVHNDTQVEHVIPRTRARKGQNLLSPSNILDLLHPKTTKCDCPARCYTKVDNLSITYTRKTNVGFPTEAQLGEHLTTIIRRDSGQLKHGQVVVCRSFFAGIHGVGLNKIRKALKASKSEPGTANVFTPDPRRRGGPGPTQTLHATTFWKMWFDDNCQRPNNSIRLFPANITHRHIYEDYFLPWAKQQQLSKSETPAYETWKKARWQKEFSDVKRRPKHFHCRCDTCAALQEHRLSAFKNAESLARWQKEVRFHDAEAHGWRKMEAYLDAEAIQKKDTTVVLSYDATDAKAFPRLSNRPIKGFTRGGMEFTPWLITNHGTKQRDYIYLPKGKWGKGANYILSQLQAMVRRIKTDPNNPQHKARRLVLIADNASENKNNIMLAWAVDMVQNQWFDEVEFLFGPVGHTHNGNDATHKVLNQDVGNHDAGDLGHHVWNYKHAWKSQAERPRASVLNCMFDFEAHYTPHLRVQLSGFTKTHADPRIVRGFKASRGADKHVDVKWKQDPANDAYWRDQEGLQGGTGYYMLRSDTPGVPNIIEPNEDWLQLKKYANKLIAPGLKLLLSPFGLGESLQANYEQIKTGIVPINERKEQTTPVGEWGPLCTIGSNQAYQGEVRFINELWPEGATSMWELPAEIKDAATSLEFHVSGDATERESAPLPLLRTTGTKANRCAMWSHPANVAHREAILLNADENAEEKNEEEEGEEDEQQPGNWNEAFFHVDFDLCKVGHFAVGVQANEGKQALWIVKIKKKNVTNMTFTGLIYECTKDRSTEDCLAGNWHAASNTAANTYQEEGATVITYFKEFKTKNRQNKLPADVILQVQKRELWQKPANVASAATN